MFGLLDIDYTRPISSIGDKFLFGGQMLLIGMAVVFAVLVLLWLSLELFRIVFARLEPKLADFSLVNLFRGNSDKPKTEKPPKPEKPKAAKKSETPAPAAPAAATDTEIIAVITAAIAASENAPIGSFRVVSFRRV